MLVFVKSWYSVEAKCSFVQKCWFFICKNDTKKIKMRAEDKKSALYNLVFEECNAKVLLTPHFCCRGTQSGDFQKREMCKNPRVLQCFLARKARAGSAKPRRDRLGASLPGPPRGGFCVLSFEPPLEPFSSESLLGKNLQSKFQKKCQNGFWA